eukprot:8533909-Pyramimonas_sp.AAC.1
MSACAVETQQLNHRGPSGAGENPRSDHSPPSVPARCGSTLLRRRRMGCSRSFKALHVERIRPVR